MRSRLSLLATITICIVILFLSFGNKLLLYIHPRYEIFTLILVCFGLIVLTISYFVEETPHDSGKGGWLIVCIAIICLFVPPSSLSDSLAGDRLNASQNSGTSNSQTTVDAFSTDLTRFDIRDWHTLLTSSPKDSMIVDKNARIEGFLFEQNGQRFIARYQLTCCAVDATPLTVPVVNSEEAQKYNDGNWVRIEGTMKIIENSEYRFQLLPKLIESIPEPEQPYVY